MPTAVGIKGRFFALSRADGPDGDLFALDRTLFLLFYDTDERSFIAQHLVLGRQLNNFVVLTLLFELVNLIFACHFEQELFIVFINKLHLLESI